MAEKTITLHIPEELYEQVEKAAQASERPLETLLLDSISLFMNYPQMPQRLDKWVEQLSSFTDSQLWGVIYHRLAENDALRLSELSDKNTQGTISTQEWDELTSLLYLVDRDMLLRSEALLLLQQRGHDVQPYLKLKS
jgi:hypothetical protein